MRTLTVIGTRPEAIKLAPVIKELQRHRVDNKVCVTGQHREMLDPFLRFFDIPVDYDLNIMKLNQDLYYITTQVLLKLREVLESEHPDVVIVQGDTTSAFCAALAAFYQKIPIAHVEAGLRTFKKYDPFPEEINRQLIDSLADWLFAPTEQAKQNLIREGIPSQKIKVTGNTIVDALKLILNDKRFRALEPPIQVPPGCHLLLVTVHRRENFGERLKAICAALQWLAENIDNIEIVYPVHLNPNVREPVYRILSGIKRIHLLEPMDYLSFLKLMEKSYLILTDSGGIQEEAPTLGKPVLVLRDVTERTEAVELGMAKVVGTDPEMIIEAVQMLLEKPEEYAKMARGINPYGDGQAAKRIVASLLESYEGKKG